MLVRVELVGAARARAMIGGISVAYSDGDEGQQQKYLLASSQLRFADGRSLGGVVIDPLYCPRIAGGAVVLQAPEACARVIK